MKKLVLLDIDYTLFNTDKFRDITYPRLRELLEQEDTPLYHQEVKNIEKALIKKGGYEPLEFAKLLAEALELKEKSSEIEELFHDSNLYRDCLYEEVFSFMKTLSEKENLILGIVSKGEQTFQRRKIGPIQNYFDNANIFISTEKTDQIDIINDQFQENEIYIIDDSEIFLQAIQQKINGIVTFLIERENRYETRIPVENFTPSMRIKNLQKVLDII